MILVSVKSNVVDDKRQFETDEAAMKYLLTINRLYHAHRIKIAGRKPRKRDFACGVRLITNQKYAKAKNEWEQVLKSCIKLRVEIVNTKFNQLNLQFNLPI